MPDNPELNLAHTRNTPPSKPEHEKKAKQTAPETPKRIIAVDVISAADVHSAIARDDLGGNVAPINLQNLRRYVREHTDSMPWPEAVKWAKLRGIEIYKPFATGGDETF